MENERIQALLRPVASRHAEIERLMSDPGFHLSPSFAATAKEHSELSEKLAKAAELDRLRRETGHLAEMLQSGDPEIAEMARAEKEDLERRVGRAERELLQLLLPRDPNDPKNIFLEIRAGTGGEEASLFAQELGRMYLRYAESKGFRCETVSISLSDRGGYKDAVFFIEGRAAGTGPFGLLKYERGVHRVQRVPVTEASGRIHTSTVTVAVLPEAEDVEVQVKPEDLRIDTYRASGHGGQHLQKTDSAVRITHLPTGLVVQCQDERSQQKNREKAMKLLKTRLLEAAREAREKEISSSRKQQVGTGERSEKIRTYNFPQDRITDHRIGLSVHNIPEVLDGHLDALVEALQLAEQKDREAQGAA